MAEPATESVVDHDAPKVDTVPTDEKGELVDRNAKLTITSRCDTLTGDGNDSASTAQDFSVTNGGMKGPAEMISEIQNVPLSIEIHERIIGFLDNLGDGGTIAACALVCRAWLPFSRFKLYYVITLRNHRQWSAFKNLVVHSNSVAIKGYLSNVRELRVVPRDKKYFDKDKTQPRIGWEKHQQRPWVHLVLLECATRLKGLTTLEAWNSDWSPSHPAAIRAGQIYHSVTALILIGTKFANPSQFHQFITAFPALQNLNLSAIRIESLRNWPLDKAGHPLNKLEVDDSTGTSLKKYFASNTQMLQALCFLCWADLAKDYESWRMITGAVSCASLKVLIYTITGVAVEISRFTNLTSVHLHIVQEDRIDTEQQLVLLRKSVSTISSSCLSDLHITLSGWTANDVSSLDTIILQLPALKEVDTILTRPQFRSLCTVRLELHVGMIFDATKDLPIVSGVSSVSLAAKIASEARTGLLSSTLAALILQSRFRNCAVNAIEFNILQELNQLNALGKLNVSVWTDALDGEFEYKMVDAKIAV